MAVRKVTLSVEGEGTGGEQAILQLLQILSAGLQRALDEHPKGQANRVAVDALRLAVRPDDPHPSSPRGQVPEPVGRP